MHCSDAIHLIYENGQNFYAQMYNVHVYVFVYKVKCSQLNSKLTMLQLVINYALSLRMKMRVL